MVIFFGIEGNWINLEHITAIRPYVSDEKPPSPFKTEICLADGKIVLVQIDSNTVVNAIVSKTNDSHIVIREVEK